jgi:hypothetical protein
MRFRRDLRQGIQPVRLTFLYFDFRSAAFHNEFFLQNNLSFFSSSEIEINEHSMEVTTPQIEEMQFHFPGKRKGAKSNGREPKRIFLGFHNS